MNTESAKGTVIKLIVTGRRLALPAIYNLETDIVIDGKNIGDWGVVKAKRCGRFHK